MVQAIGDSPGMWQEDRLHAAACTEHIPAAWIGLDVGGLNPIKIPAEGVHGPDGRTGKARTGECGGEIPLQGGRK